MSVSTARNPRPFQTPLFSSDDLPIPSNARFDLYHQDAFDWLRRARPCSVHAVVTDPPYGLVEYSEEQLLKRQNGHGGIWRIPPSFDGHQRRPLPRFTVLTTSDRDDLSEFFTRFARALIPVLVPGAHVFIATNPLVSHLVYVPFIDAGFEKRGEIIRLVSTLRGGDSAWVETVPVREVFQCQTAWDGSEHSWWRSTGND